MYVQNTVPFPRFLLVMLVGWLVLLFVSFGIFAPRNPLVLAGLFVSATVAKLSSLTSVRRNEPEPARRLVEIRMAYVEHKEMCPICLAHD